MVRQVILQNVSLSYQSEGTMARFDSYRWDHMNGVCLVHMLPSIPCPACLSDPKSQPDMYLVLEKIERDGWLEYDEMIIPAGFDPSIHAVH